MQFLLGRRQTLGNHPQLFGGTSVHDSSMNDRHDGGFSPVLFRIPLFLKSHNSRRTMPTRFEPAGSSASTREVHQLSGLENFNLSGFTTSRSQDPSSSIGLEEPMPSGFHALEALFVQTTHAHAGFE